MCGVNGVTSQAVCRVICILKHVVPLGGVRASLGQCLVCVAAIHVVLGVMHGQAVHQVVHQATHRAVHVMELAPAQVGPLSDQAALVLGGLRGSGAGQGGKVSIASVAGRLACMAREA